MPEGWDNLVIHCQAPHCFLEGICFPVFFILLSFYVAHRPECPPQGPSPSWHVCWVCLNYLSSKRLKMVHRDKCNVMTPALPYNRFSQAGSKDAWHLCNLRLQWGDASSLGYPKSFFNRFGWVPWKTSEWLPFPMPDAQGLKMWIWPWTAG